MGIRPARTALIRSAFTRTAVTLLLSAGCLPALAADPVCHYNNIGSLAIRYSDPGMQPSIEGSVNGKPITMLIDTGASYTLLMSHEAEAAGVVLKHSGQHAVGIGGWERIYTGRVDTLKIGPVALTNFKMRVLDNDSKRVRYGGIVGVDFMLQLDMQISLANRKLSYFRGSDDACRDAFLADKEKAVVLDYLPPYRGDPRPNIEVTLNGKKLTAVIDSGAFRSGIFRRAAERAGITTESPGVVKTGKTGGIGDVRPDVWRVPVESFSVGSHQYSGLKLQMIDDGHRGSGGSDILLGADFLRAYDVLFAKSQNKMYLTYRGGQIFSTDSRGEAAWFREEADLGNSRAQYQVARDLFVAGDYKGSAGYFDGAAKGKTDGPNVHLFHYVALARSGDRAGALTALTDHRDKVAGRPWQSAMANYLLGQIDASALLAARDADPAKQKLQTCEANFVQAQHKLLLGEREAAKALLDTATTDCPASTFERAAALAELKRW
jgi:predicted aspartyl protease